MGWSGSWVLSWIVKIGYHEGEGLVELSLLEWGVLAGKVCKRSVDFGRGVRFLSY